MSISAGLLRVGVMPYNFESQLNSIKKVAPIMKFLLVALLLSSCSANAENESLRYTDRLTKGLEKDAFSVYIAAWTNYVEAKLCQRIKEPAGQELQTEFVAWEQRNQNYIEASRQVITEFKNHFLMLGGEDVAAQFIDRTLKDMQAEVDDRVAEDMYGANSANKQAPPERVCSVLAKYYRSGRDDYENRPNETVSLREYMKHRLKAP
jgi:hypothetical protein